MRFPYYPDWPVLLRVQYEHIPAGACAIAYGMPVQDILGMMEHYRRNFPSYEIIDDDSWAIVPQGAHHENDGTVVPGHLLAWDVESWDIGP